MIASVVFVMATVTVAQIESSRLEGKFEFDDAGSQLNEKFLALAGYHENQIKEAMSVIPEMTLELSIRNGTFISKITAKGKQIKNVIEVGGKEFLLKRFVGSPVKAIAYFDPQIDVLSIHAQFPKTEVVAINSCREKDDSCATKCMLKDSEVTGYIKWRRAP